MALAVLLLAGCTANRPGGSEGVEAPVVESEPGIRYPVVTPVLAVTGTVMTVNPRLRFVVLDFGVNPLPAVDDVLEVYRQGLKVGEVRVSGPSRGSTTVADILSGEARPEDEVRPR